MAADSLTRFFDDIRASLAVRAPIDLGSSSSLLTQSRANEYCQKMAEQVALGQTPGKLNESSDGVPSSLLAAYQVYDLTGSSSTLLDGLVARNVATGQVTKITRWPLCYLCILMMFSLVGLVFYSSQIAPIILDFQSDMFYQAHDRAFDSTNQVSMWLTGASGVLMLLLVFWIVLGGAKRLVLWLGGREYVGTKVAWAAIEVSQRLIAVGVEPEQARKMGLNLVSATNYERRLVEVSSQRLQTDSDLIMERSLLDQRTANCLNHLRIITPIVFVAVFGGVLTLLYCVVLLWPLIVLLSRSVYGGYIS